MTDTDVSNGAVGDTTLTASLEDYEKRLSVIRARAELARERMASVKPSASSPDGSVTVTVNASGALEDLQLGAASESMPREQLAQAVLRAARDAHRLAAVQTQQALSGLVGENSSAMKFMQRYVPPAEPEPTTTASRLDDGPAARPATPHASPSAAPETAPQARPAASRSFDDEDDGFTGR